MANQALPLQLLLLGTPEVRLAGTTLVFPTRKTLALLIYLALSEGPQPREHLAALLWPEASPERSYASLRNTLGHMQQTLRGQSDRLPPNLLSISHTTLGFGPQAGIELDLAAVERAYASARADRSSRARPANSHGSPALLLAAAASYRGDFLAGFSLGDAAGFDDWAGVQREAWRRRVSLILDRLSEIQFAQGDFAATAETAASWIALDAMNEVAYRRKMRAHFAAGERGQALETYQACRALLAAELQVEPDPTTEALAARIRAQLVPERRAAARFPVDTPVTFLEGLFIGRAAEQRALAGAFESAAAGRMQVVSLRGEAGIGKTRLAGEFLAWAAAHGADVLPGSAHESGSQLPFLPLIRALRVWLQGEPAPAAWASAPWVAPLTELLPELRERYPEIPPLKLDPHAGRAQLFEAVTRLVLTLAGRKPVVLFVDDLQWADSATLDLLQYANRRWQEAGAQVMVLLSLRSETLRSWSWQPGSTGLIQWLAQAKHELAPLDLDLGPLSEADTVQMVLSFLEPAAPDFAEWVFADTHGHPFYLIETLKDLLERGALHPKRRATGQWIFEVDADHELGQRVRVPSTVGAVVRSRLNRLSPVAFTMLAAAAILEAPITFERLGATGNVADDAALAAMDELLSSRLLVEAPALFALTGGYTFPNDMIREVVYTEAGDARRRLFHRRALEVLAVAGAPAAVLAHHALGGGLAKAALEHSLAAGEAAMRLSAGKVAVGHFERARALLQERPLDQPELKAQTQEVYRQLGQAYEMAGRHGQAAAIYEDLAALERE